METNLTILASTQIITLSFTPTPCWLARSLTLTGNRFRQPSYQVLSKGTEQLLAYLRNKLPEEEKEEPKDVGLPSSVSYFIS